MRVINKPRETVGNRSKKLAYKSFATLLGLAMMCSLACLSSVRAGTLASSSQVAGPWGQISNNFQLSISTTKNSVLVGQPLMLTAFLRNLGPEVLFRTFDLPDEYLLLCHSTSPAGACIRRSALLNAHNIGHGSFDLHNKTDIYKTIIDISDIYDIKPGIYQMRLEFPIIPTSVHGTILNSRPIAHPVSNVVTVTVLK